MKTFKINDEYEVVCRFEKTRYGFRHLARLMSNGYEVETAKACYQNRTWESFEYESVIEKLLRKTSAISDDEKERFLAVCKGEDVERVNQTFGLLKAVCAMGEIMNDGNVEAQNDFKKRMVKASMGDAVSFPDDWKEISEDEKKRRLDKAVSVGVGSDA